MVHPIAMPQTGYTNCKTGTDVVAAVAATQTFGMRTAHYELLPPEQHRRRGVAVVAKAPKHSCCSK